MKKIIFFLGKSLVILVIVMTSYLQAQNSGVNPPFNPGVTSFERTFGYGAASSIFNDSITGDVYVAGGRGGAVLAKFDSTGNNVWFRRYENCPGYVTFLVKIPGGFILGGTLYNFIQNTIFASFVLKVDNDGNFIDGKTFANDGFGGPGANADLQIHCGEATSDAYYLAGESKGFSCGYGLLLIKLDTNLNVQWSKIYGYYLSAYSIKQTTDGTLVMTGYCNNSITCSQDLFILKVDFNGLKIWSKYYGSGIFSESEGTEVGKYIGMSKDNKIIVVGETRNGFIYGWGTYIAKVDLNGLLLWSKVATNHYFNVSYGVALQNNGNIVAVGCAMDTITLDMSPSIISFNPDGFINWSKRIDNAINGEARAVSISNSSSFFVAGKDQDRFYLAKINSNKNLNCADSNLMATSILVQSLTGDLPIVETFVSPVMISINAFDTSAMLTIVNYCYLDTTSVDTIPHVDTTYIAELLKDNSSIYPNPAKDYINIVNAKGKVLFVYNSIGEQVFSKKIVEENENLNLNINLISGVYLYKIDNSQMKKLIVLK